jgi:UDP-glucuronate decarboxylase
MQNPDLSFLDGSRILVTGAGGFIGQNICKHLLQEVQKSDIEIDLVMTSRSKPRLCLSEDSNQGKIVLVDLLHPNSVLSLGKYDFIIHCASSAQPSDFISNSLDTFNLNAFVTSALLSQLNPLGHFLFMSSTEVYSGNPSKKYTETMNGDTSPSHMRAGYIEGKRAGEFLTSNARNQGVKATSARLSYTYGPYTKSNDSRVINQFIQKAVVNKLIQLEDSGTAIRSNLFVDDAVLMLINLLREPGDNVYNISGLESNSILELATLIGEIMSVPVKTNSAPSRLIGENQHALIDMTRYTNDFGAPALTALRDGLQSTIDWQLQNIF